MTASAHSPIASNDNRENNGKLTRVVSTKLSIEHYKAFRILTKQAYKDGVIKHDSPSEMLRYVLSPVVEEFRKLPAFSSPEV
jgi:hypothetical protein